MSLYLLKSLKGRENELSTLLEDKNFIDRCNGTDIFMAEMNSLLAKGFISLKHEYDEDEGDDYIIDLSKSGKAFLRFKEREKESKNDWFF